MKIAVCSLYIQPWYREVCKYGKQMMDELLAHFSEKFQNKGLLMLFSAKGKSQFYQKFGFVPREHDAPGMVYSPRPKK